MSLLSTAHISNGSGNLFLASANRLSTNLCPRFFRGVDLAIGELIDRLRLERRTQVLQPMTLQLRPGIGLRPMHVTSSQIKLTSHGRVSKCAPTDAISTLDKEYRATISGAPGYSNALLLNAVPR